VHPDRQVLALASIGMDHTEHLGPTLAAIAAEKAGVLHGGAVAVSGPQAPEVEAELERQAAALGCGLRWLEPLPPEAQGGPRLGLAGDLQRHNAAVALAAAQALAERGWPIDADAMARGLETARWPGRLEHRSFAGRPLLLDGAHNPPAAVALRRELDRLEPRRSGPASAPRRWLIGIQRHKHAPPLLRALLRPGDALRVAALPDHACWSAAELRALPELQVAPLEISEASGDLQADLHWLVASAALPVACGSLYLVAELLPLLEADAVHQGGSEPTD